MWPRLLLACEDGACTGLKHALEDRYAVIEVSPGDLLIAAERERPAGIIFMGERATAPYLCRTLRKTAGGAAARLVAIGRRDDEVALLEAGADIFAAADAPLQLVAARLTAALRRA
jgi:DNA-binding response OmpR family regulator